jgi:hypothetical protein
MPTKSAGVLFSIRPMPATPNTFTQNHIAEILWRELPAQVSLFRKFARIFWYGGKRIEIEVESLYIAGVLESPQCFPCIGSSPLTKSHNLCCRRDVEEAAQPLLGTK